jgi:hypothetical protein
MDYATTDLGLAIAHHLLVFMIAGVLAFEIGAVRPTMKRDEILGVGRVDNWYGILCRRDYRRWLHPGQRRGQGLGLLRGQHILLGKDRDFRRRRPALDCSNGGDNSLAQGAAKRSRFCATGGRHSSRSRLPLGGSGPVPFAPGVRRDYGPGLWRIDPVILRRSSARHTPCCAHVGVPTPMRCATPAAKTGKAASAGARSRSQNHWNRDVRLPGLNLMA